MAMSRYRDIGPVRIKRLCYNGSSRPRVWWWKLIDGANEIVADGFSSSAEAKVFAAMNRLELVS